MAPLLSAWIGTLAIVGALLIATPYIAKIDWRQR
jgi:hypothetical protein